jgi:hypothetical protein
MRRRSLLLVVLCTGLLAQRATANVQHGIMRRDLMPKIKDMHAEIKCDACLTTVERFMAMWKAVTSKVTLHVQHAPHCVFSDYAGQIEKEEGDDNTDLRAGKDGPRLNINHNVTHSVATMCTPGGAGYEGKLDGFRLPAYLEEACEDMVGSEFEHGPLRFKLQKNFIGQTARAHPGAYSGANSVLRAVDWVCMALLYMGAQGVLRPKIAVPGPGSGSTCRGSRRTSARTTGRSCVPRARPAPPSRSQSSARIAITGCRVI